MVDLGFRTAYRIAHRMLRTWWKVRRPRTHGALVAVWYRGALLLVKNSYRKDFTLPGGYVRPGETAIDAAARELAEEVGIDVERASLRQAYDGTLPYENRSDHVTIVEFEAQDPPSIEVDNREVVWAGFEKPETIAKMRIIPHLRHYLEGRDSDV